MEPGRGGPTGHELPAMAEITIERAQFSAMTEGTAQDWQRIGAQFFPFAQELPERILKHLKLLDGDFGGFPIDRLQHSLQTATRAQRDGRDDEYVVCALLHDIGDTLGPYNHFDIAAAVLQPFVSEANLWMVRHHGIFQGYCLFPPHRTGPRPARAVRWSRTLRPHGRVLRTLRQPGVRSAGPRAGVGGIRAAAAARVRCAQVQPVPTQCPARAAGARELDFLTHPGDPP